MKYKLAFILFAAFINIYGQNRVMVSYNPGYFIYNSENFLHITDQYKIGSFPGLSAAFERDSVLGFNIHLEYDFNYYNKFGMVEFNWGETNSTLDNRFIFTNYFLTSHNYDVSLLFKLFNKLNFSLGPSFAVYSRTFEYHEPLPPGVIAPGLYDRLVSYCLGVNGAMNFNYPLSDSKNYFFLYSGLKFRYVHSFRFDARGRNLDNYFQSFLTVQLNLGMGYNF